MQLAPDLHLTYCTNIHAGESWQDVFTNLQKYVPAIKSTISPNEPFGIGLRLSNEAAQSLVQEAHLQEFKNWLNQNDCYVFTMNGFPFGGFHQQKVKDKVHQPDWTTNERLTYTVCLFKILAELLPQNIDGGISTSPLSYKHWHNKEGEKANIFQKSTQNILWLLLHLIELKNQTNKVLHLDIEPEPDGLIENSEEVILFYEKYLIPQGILFLKEKLHYSSLEATEAILRHIQICYDVCHFAVAYENHAEALQKFYSKGIKIGKFQISAALKVDFSDISQKKAILTQLQPFNESVYLHQVIERKQDGTFQQYADLPLALANANEENIAEWRIHFHVPIFLEKYGLLASTQSDILEVFRLLKSNHYTHHLEVETYTWDVLPQALQLDLQTSIQREMQWVFTHFDSSI